jgi:hypothetical protein
MFIFNHQKSDDVFSMHTRYLAFIVICKIYNNGGVPFKASGAAGFLEGETDPEIRGVTRTGTILPTAHPATAGRDRKSVSGEFR